MKKLILLVVILFSLISARAQTADEFKTYSQNLEQQRQQASQQKDYVKGLSLLEEWFQHYNNLPEGVKKNFTGWTAGIYYNMACYAALNGKNEQAVDYFEKCVNAGYRGYAHTLTDTDLDAIREDKRFKAALQKLRETGDFGYILKKSGSYNRQKQGLPVFTYQQENSPELAAFKSKFNLDSVAGNGDEISKFKRLLFWVHNAVKHDGNSNNPLSRNGTDLIEVCRKENRGVNCRMMATILRDAYQAEGFKTRVVTCMPKDTTDNDCHVITVVWSDKLNKWVWMDPTFNAYVSDEKGNLLNIQEVRERLIGGKALVLNEDANWNNVQKQTKANYLDYYMSKNLFWIQCAAKSQWDVETRKDGKAIEYINLYPGTYSTIHQEKKTGPRNIEYATNNPDYFWQKPTDYRP